MSRCCFFIFGLVLTSSLAFAQRPLGTDVSAYQPNVNWNTVKNGGVKFAWAKATEGTGWNSIYFVSQQNGARGVHIPIGAYHFARPSSHPNLTGANSADSEAAFFWSVVSNYVKADGLSLVPMLDWEDTDATLAAGLTTAEMSAWVNRWCNTVSNYARAQGVVARPIVYTGVWFSKPGGTYPGLNSTVTSWPSWIAAYPSNPAPQTGGPTDCSPWPTWDFWQYADTNWSGGDADVYKSTWSDLTNKFLVAPNGAPRVLTNPVDITVVAGSNATFSVQAAGNLPLSFQWLFNGAVIPGATSSNYTLLDAQLTDIGRYSVVISNSVGSYTSAGALLSVIGPWTNRPGAVLAPAGLANWWPADGNARDFYGTAHGTPFEDMPYTNGFENLAFRFNGVDGFISNSAPTLAGPWTFCCWVNRQDAPGTSACLVSDGTNSLKLEQYNGTRKVGLTVLGVADYVINYTVPQNAWVHLAFVNNGSQTALYANGILKGATNAIPLPRRYFGAAWIPSGSKFVDYMLGRLDEIQVFNRALSQSEIAAIYNAGSAGFVRAPDLVTADAAGLNHFSLTFRGLTGKSVSIYRTADFESWTRIATGVANAGGEAIFTDLNATNDQFYYRVSQP